MLTLAIALNSELWDPLKIPPMRWLSSLRPFPKRYKQSLRDYQKENRLKVLLILSLKRQNKFALKETATVKNGKFKLRREDFTSTKFSVKFTPLWRNSKMFLKN